MRSRVSTRTPSPGLSPAPRRCALCSRRDTPRATYACGGPQGRRSRSSDPGATRRAIRQLPSSPCSTSWPATSASRPSASCVCSLTSSGGQQAERVLDQPVDQCRLGNRVVPSDGRFARGVVVMGADRNLLCSGHLSANPTDGRDELGDRVLGGNRVVEQGGVKCAASLPPQHPGRRDHLAHRLEDALGPRRAAQPGPPVGEDGRVEALVIQGKATGHLPADAITKCTAGVSVGESFEGLQHHHRGDYIGRHRGPTTVGRKQILEKLVREKFVSMVGQKGLDTTFPDQLTTE